MPGWWIAGIVVVATVFLLVTGFLDDLVRVVIWDLGAAVGLLVWYGPVRLWRSGRKE
jgi:hypothetical protein